MPTLPNESNVTRFQRAGRGISGRMVLLAILMLVLINVGLSSHATANFVMVYDNNVTPNTGFFADAGSSNQRIYDNFTLGGDAAIDRIVWSGLYASRRNTTDDFTIQIYEANGSLPGSLVTQVSAGNVSEQAVGTLLNRDRFEYEFTFNQIQLNAGDTYFLSITNDTGEGWAWATENGSGQIAYSSNAGNTFLNHSAEMDFQFYQATVPEANTITMTMIACMVCSVRRFRRKKRQVA